MTFLLKCALGENLGNLQGSSLHLPEEPTEENHLRGSEEVGFCAGRLFVLFSFRQA